MLSKFVLKNLSKKIRLASLVRQANLTTAIIDKDHIKTITNPTLSYATTQSEFPLISSPIRDFVAENALTIPNKMVYALPHQGHFSITFKDLSERVDTAAQNLLNLGFQKGDRIAIVLPNTLELIVTFLASCKIGVISTILNPAYQTLEFEHALNKTRAKGVVIYDSFKTLKHMEILTKLCPELETCQPGELNSKQLPHLKHVFVINSPLIKEKKEYKGTWKFSEISESKSTHLNHEIPHVDVEDPCLILFTSGTTGKSKGALMSNYSVLNSTYLSTISVGKLEEMTWPICNPIPLFHVYGLATGLLIPLLFGCSKVFPFFFPDTLTTLKAIEKYKCILLRAVPTQYIDLINHPERKNHDLSSLKYAVVGASTVPPDLLVKMKTELNIQAIIVGYGMTETSLCHSMTTFSDKHKSFRHAYESVGRPIPYTETKIVDPLTGKTLPLNQDGELYVRGAHLFKGYWEDPEKTAETFDQNGWLKTGDLFSMDEEGYLYFKSRIKDVIIRGGANIYPSEVETYLRTHPSILDAQVFGVPDERMGEEVCAWIKLKPNVQLTEVELREFCKGNISHFKIPKYVKFVDSFPINASAKVLKNKMREMAANELKATK